MRKIPVAAGVYWLEVPEAKLSVLCGCPADSVKHLKKRGLIVPVEKDGYTFESGPNAILLSDVLVQNGGFANLAEFPVLQMLYLQGIILPGHPNNTGEKPLLIGSAGQVGAQMHYIYRGNYGLTSEEEIRACGISPELAREMMEMKLKFSFGKILSTDEFLATRIVENKPVEIQNGVTIRRQRLNVFEFQYQGQSVVVDLNLKPGMVYGSPYTLGFQNIRREYFSVIHTGDGDGWDINRPCMASIIIFQGKVFLIDAGPNLTASLKALGIGINEVEGIFHTHSHDDHFCGLATLLGTDHRIKYYATPLVRASVTKKLSSLTSMEEDEFFHYFDVHDLDFGVWNDINGLEVKPVFSPHPVETHVMVFRALGAEGYRSYAHFADVVSLDVLAGMVRVDDSSPGISREFFDQVKKDYAIAADIKKIDIGGGMIHGKAEDFEGDASPKIFLAHTDRELTDREKEIGSGAPFGMVDVLISSFQDYIRSYAHEFLQTYFPVIPRHQLRILLNNPVVKFNPESILLKTGTDHESIYLILTGSVEAIRSDFGVNSILTAGAMVGDMAVEPAEGETYRAVSVVQTLRMPVNLFREFVRQNDAHASMQYLQEKRSFLKKTRLFGEAISCPIRNEIAKALEFQRYGAGQELPPDDGTAVFLVRSGRLERYVEESLVEELGVGDFFGEDRVLYGTPSLFKARVKESVDLFRINGELLLNIPVVRWRLLETYRKRMEMIFGARLISAPIFYWRAEYTVNIRAMDREHRQLFDTANTLYEAVCIMADPVVQDELLDALIWHAEAHFSAEEELLQRFDYPGYEAHKQRHQGLMDEIRGRQAKIRLNKAAMTMEFVGFMKDWVTEHIVTEDRKYGKFLNGKGVF